MMVKEEGSSGCCKPIVLAALLLALGMLGCSYLLSQVDFSPDVNVSDLTSTPNIYVSSIPPDHELSVSGTASQKVEPDLLLIQLRVQTEAGSASRAQADNAAVSADLRSKLAAVGVGEDYLKTVSYRVEPVYESEYVCDAEGYRCHWDSRLTGYRAIHQLQAELTDTSKGGEVIDAAATAGTNQTFTDGVYFTLQEETRAELEKTLLKEASVDAHSKAQKMAEGLGIQLGKVLSASESYSYYPYYYRDTYAMEAASAAAPTVLSPGEVEVSASVSVAYEIF